MSTINKIFSIKHIYQSGRSMVEMIGVLAIVGVLSVGGIAGYVKASHQIRTNKIKDDISHLIANIRTVFYTQNNYKNLNETTVINSGIAPDYMISSDRTSLINRSKGSILVKSAKTEEDDEGAFIIIFNGFDALTCREIASENWGSDIQTGFIGMTIKNNGDLTIESSGLVEAKFDTTETTFNSIDLPQSLITQSYSSCDCGHQDLCSIAWKFI